MVSRYPVVKSRPLMLSRRPVIDSLPSLTLTFAAMMRAWSNESVVSLRTRQRAVSTLVPSNSSAKASSPRPGRL